MFSFSNQWVVGDNDVCVNTGPFNGYNKYYLNESVTSNVEWTISTYTSNSYMTGIHNDTIYIQWTQFGQYYSNVTANYGGTFPSTISVKIHDVTHPTLNGDFASCKGVIKTYTTEAGFSNYSWQFNGCTKIEGGTSTLNYITVKWNNTGYISVNYTNNFGCSAQNSTLKSVMVTESPIITIFGNDSVCGGVHNYESHIENLVTGEYEYQWDAINGSFWSSINGATCDIGWNNPGVGMVKVNVKDPYGCESNSQMIVKIFPSVTPSLTGEFTNLCVGTTFIYSTDPNQSNYLWNVNGGNILSGQGTDSIRVVWTSPGYHNINVSYVTSTGCTANETFQVSVFNQPISTIVGSDTNIYLTTVTYITENNMNNYIWNIVGGDIIQGGTLNDNYVKINWNSIGTESVSVSYQNSIGCVSTLTTKNIEIIPSICMITYDSTFNWNRIYVKNVPNTFNHYNIYKWNNQSEWEKIGEIPTNTISYLDTTSIPYQSPYKYKISVGDPESSKSPPHQTIWLHYGTSDQDLMWTAYIGYEFNSYEIWRKIDNEPWELIATKPNDILVYTDNYTGNGIRSYFIQVIPLCTPTNLKNSNFTIKSNIYKPKTYGIDNLNKLNIKIYPNPVIDNLTIDLSEGLNYVNIYDIKGRLLYSKITSNSKFTLSVIDYPSGIYIVKIKNKHQFFTGKFNKIN